MSNKALLFCIFLLLLLCHHIRASHLRAGEITVERISCSSLTFRITITAYIDTESGVTLGGYFLYFGDSAYVLVPEIQTKPRPDLGQHMGIATFTTEHTYSGPGTYFINYTEEFRNQFIVNIDRSEATSFYLETKLVLDPFFSCNQNLPDLLIPPIDRACMGVAFFHNPGAIDVDGDSLSYQLSVPKREKDQIVWGYKPPNDAKFYLNFPEGDEEKKGPPLFSIDAISGTLTWNAPGALGEYNIAFVVIEWRKDRSGVWREMSSTLRDMQIIVGDCDNDRPDLMVPLDTCVVAGALLKKKIFGIDPENDHVKIEVFSEILSLYTSPATYKPLPPVFQSSTPRATVQFEWQTQCEHVKEQYYQVVFKITDKPKDGPGLVTFKTWRIKVVGPPPQWTDAHSEIPSRTATLQWKSYECEKAVVMQVWRKIGGSDYEPENCVTGMPDFLGYDLVSEVPLHNDSRPNEQVTKFIDTNGGRGLAPGAVYCYRLVAIFPAPRGGQSYVSKDTCLAPILADVPVITHVTVERTDTVEGAVRISWYSPFEIDRSQFPGPFQYAVYRANDFEGGDLTLITPAQRIVDTTFVDTGINTEKKVFNYRIVLYSNTKTDPTSWIAIDTSSVASTVRAEASDHTDRIFLTWKAVVPWSNSTEQYPYHLIYRGSDNQAADQFQLIDSVYVPTGGFVYNDRHIPDRKITYCYRIVTRGSYGNPEMSEPFENLSQVICVIPDEGGMPCAPVAILETPDCNEIFLAAKCDVREFSNRISWTSECEDQVGSYRVYAASGKLADDEFVLIAENVKDPFYLDKNLSSFAKCYKITAVDRQGNESKWSEMVCNDNCPYFELPNVFTPNGDECNDHFSAYGPFNPLNQHSPESCDLGNENYSKCLRFVSFITFRVFNRWGGEVYHYSSDAIESSSYINWDGKDSEGRWLASGVYYYQANVTFNVLDTAKQRQTIKGWIHLVR